MLQYDLFDKETFIKINVFSQLFKNDGWYPINDLSEDCNIHVKTLKKYIDLLNNDIRDLYGESSMIKIDYRKIQGVYFSGDKLDFQRIHIFIIEKSISFSFMHNLLLAGKVGIEQFISTHYVSESSLRKKITQLNQFLESFGLSLETVNQVVVLNGNELQIRFFAYTFFWGIYEGIDWPFTLFDESVLAGFIENEFKRYLTLKKIAVSQWCYIIAINFYRIRSNSAITTSDLPIFSYKLNEIYNDDYIAKLRFSLQQFHIFSEPECHYLLLLFQLTGRFYSINDHFERALQFHKSENTLVYKMYHSYFLVVQPNLESADIKKQKKYKNLVLATFLSLELFPYNPTTFSGHNYDRYLNDRYPYLKHAMEERVDQLKEKINSKLLDNKQFLVARFAELHGMICSLVDFNPLIVINLETDLPMVMEEILSQQIKSVLSPFYNISLILSQDIDEFSTIDLVISTTKPFFLSDKQSKKIVYIHPALEPKDIYNLFSHVENLST